MIQAKTRRLLFLAVRLAAEGLTQKQTAQRLNTTYYIISRIRRKYRSVWDDLFAKEQGKIAKADTKNRLWTAQAFYAETYRPLRLLGRARTTVEGYEVTLNHWRRIMGNLPLWKIDDQAIAVFAEALLHDQKPPTVNKNLRQLAAILRFAQHKGEIDTVPGIAKIPENLAMPRAFLLDEVSAIVSATQRVSGTIAGICAADWWQALVLVLYDCGGRIGAVLATPTMNLNLDDGWIMLPAENQKQRRGQDLRLHSDTMTVCRKIWRADRELMWPWPYHRGVVHKRFRRILAAAEVHTWKGTGSQFHRLRKSCASYAAAAGLDPVVQMGHSSASVTARYLDERIIGRKHAADVLPRPEVFAAKTA